MKCDRCKKEIGKTEPTGAWEEAFQVRVGYIEEDGITFQPDEDVGYYCSKCLSEGV